MARKRIPTPADAVARRVNEQAKRYGIGLTVLRNAIASGALEASKLGPYPRSPVIVADAAVDKWLEACRVKPRTERAA